MMYTVSTVEIPYGVMEAISLSRGIIIPAMVSSRGWYVVMNANRFDMDLVRDAAETIGELYIDLEITAHNTFTYVHTDGKEYAKTYVDYKNDDYCIVTPK